MNSPHSPKTRISIFVVVGWTNHEGYDKPGFVSFNKEDAITQANSMRVYDDEIIILEYLDGSTEEPKKIYERKS